MGATLSIPGGQNGKRITKTPYFADTLPTGGHIQMSSNPVCSTKKNLANIGFVGFVRSFGCRFGATWKNSGKRKAPRCWPWGSSCNKGFPIWHLEVLIFGGVIPRPTVGQRLTPAQKSPAVRRRGATLNDGVKPGRRLEKCLDYADA